MRILHVASEVAPYSQSGGLGQVLGALPAALARTDSESTVATLSPFYRQVGRYPANLENTDQRLRAFLAGTQYDAQLLTEPGTGNFFVDCPLLFDRPGGLYAAGNGESWSDSPVQFALLCRAAVDFATEILGGPADVIHAHDWQAGLVAPYLALRAKETRVPRTVFTIHNLAFQGIFDKSYIEALGLDWSLFHWNQLEFYDQLSFLKGGAAFSDQITTVSPTYAKEIQTEKFGCGLDAFFRNNRRRLLGILNGIDTAAWNPATDPHIAANYSSSDRAGKTQCRSELARRFGLQVADDQLLCGVVSRLTEQKGPDLIGELVPKFSGLNTAVVVLGSGDAEIERRFQKLGEWFSHHLSVVVGFDDSLAHQIFAGCDALLMPSRFEPCGLAQLSAMRYGTLPIAHATGGLADTVLDPGDREFAKQAATGFLFRDAIPSGLEWAMARAAHMFRKRPELWNRAVDNAMARDWSWTPAAREYLAVYRNLLSATTR